MKKERVCVQHAPTQKNNKQIYNSEACDRQDTINTVPEAHHLD